MEPIDDWLEETLAKAGLNAKDGVFTSDHHLFDAEMPRNLQSEDELYGAPMLPRGGFKPAAGTSKEARDLEVLTVQVANVLSTIDTLNDNLPPEVEEGEDPVPLTKVKRYEDMTDGEKFGRDAITLPHHYARYAIEPIRFVVENNLNFLQANIVKYVLRFDAKNGMEDLDKAARYLTMLKRWAAKDPDWWKR